MPTLNMWTLLLSLSAILASAEAHSPSSRFASFFGNSAPEFAYVSTVTCNATLARYHELYNNSTNVAAIDLGFHSQHVVIAACNDHESCILGNSSEKTKASLSTAGVVLGLLPTLLAVLSPSIAEIALLTAQRPWLAMISCLGSPGVLSTRIFEYSDPGELLDMPEDIHTHHGKRIRLQLVLGPWRRGWLSTVVVLLEWILVLAAVVNTQWLAVELSRKSILSWGCTRAIWPTVLWACIPVVINGIGAVGYHLTLDKKKSNDLGRLNGANDIGMTANSSSYNFSTKPENGGTVMRTGTSSSNSPPQSISPMVDGKNSTTRKGLLSRICARILDEFIPAACHPVALSARLNYGKVPSPRVTAGVFLYCLAGFLSFFHLLYGTVTFSGLLFVDILDAIGEVAMRLLVSSLVCRFVVLIEVAGMRGAVAASQ